MAIGWNISLELRAKAIKAFLLLLAVPLLAMLSPSEAKANVVCLVNSAQINFGTSESGVGSVNYTCTNYSTSSANFQLCTRRGKPNPGAQGGFPVMQSNGNFLRFRLYRDPAHTQQWKNNNTDYISKPVSIPAGNGVSVSGSFAFYGLIAPGQNATAGNYNSGFNNARLGFVKNNGNCARKINNQGLEGQSFWLPVSAVVSNDCTVNALGDVDLGMVASSASSVSGSTSISVDCPTGTSYTIGLQPSNGNNNGLGVLTGQTGGNTDQPPYSLHSGSAAGPIWGNTASLGNVGNGVSGTGNGSAQNYGAYVTVPSTEFTPDNYSDTVLVTVHY